MSKKRARSKKSPVLFPLRQVLERLGMSQYKLSQMSGIAESYISRLAQGKSVPVWTTVMRIATSIEADLGDFMPRPPVARAKRAARSKEVPSGQS